MSSNPEEPQSPTFWQVVHSCLAAMFGVQSDKARARDFQYGKPWHYICMGIILTTLFVLMLLGIVKFILAFAP